MIRKATPKDIEAILEITKACAKHMITNNIFQWNAHYPNKEAFKNDIDRQELYVLELKNTIVGCVVISTHMDNEYQPITWLTPNTNNIYIHRLAIHPKHQRQGFAQKLMNYAETYSKNNHYTSVRLDTFSQNHRNQKFYEHRGYQKRGAIFFPKQSELPFHCYELVL
ncbi:GNAT family N-acetyltransferase [Psychroserpens damuponensis]|uniref:GNAT family N-acetyltransferase n=1 Tax=Psychroserpens damuponensis TaxID=943936 RepID=UPI00058E65CA|nr:GNAT family N-acetyltransferase [Psychroserpens damuponensis]